MFCARCGEQIPDASETCPLCGRETTLRIDPAPLSHQSTMPNFYYAGSGVQGVGGWLLFFCLILTLAGPVIVFAQIAAQPHGPNSYNLIDVARVLYGVVVGIILWMQRRIAIQLVGIYFIVVLATIVLVLLIYLAAWTSTKSPLLLGRGIGSILPSVIHNVLWFLYFRKSERVRNTYGANL